MKRIVPLMLVPLALWFSGCASQPQTAEEFRQAVPGAAFAKVETIQANRPFAEVADTFKVYGPKCLNLRIETTSQTRTSYQVIVARYKPTVVVTDKKAELHIQERYEQGVIMVGKEPEEGHYLLVADAYPLNESTTQLDLYRPSMGHDPLIRAVKGWATGENVGCPDLTK